MKQMERERPFEYLKRKGSNEPFTEETVRNWYIARSYILEKLKECFLPERAAQIYCYALILCANGFLHLDQVDDFYQESFLSVKYRKYSFKMGYTALSNLLHDLGLRGNPVRRFESVCQSYLCGKT